jgi:hypothetical protein
MYVDYICMYACMYACMYVFIYAVVICWCRFWVLYILHIFKCFIVCMFRFCTYQCHNMAE